MDNDESKNQHDNNVKRKKMKNEIMSETKKYTRKENIYLAKYMKEPKDFQIW